MIADFTLSVLMPVYNEAPTIPEILRRVRAAPYQKQIIVVDDGSTDGTSRILQRECRDHRDTLLLRHPTNRGKGTALRAAIPHATGQVTIIQDGDLEYDPNDYPLLVEVIRSGQSDVVYGSRYLSGTNTLPWTQFRLGVLTLNWMVRVLYGQPMTDEATCYKAFRTKLLQELHLVCRRFEFCPEVTAKCIRRGHRIIEVPIRYHYRTVEQGKKIAWRDGFEAVMTLLRWRFIRSPIRVVPADATTATSSCRRASPT